MFYSPEETEWRKAETAKAIVQVAEAIKQRGHTLSTEQTRALSERVAEFIDTSGPSIPSDVLGDMVSGHMALCAAELLGETPEGQGLALQMELSTLGAHAVTLALQGGGYTHPGEAVLHRLTTLVCQEARKLASRQGTVTREQALQRMTGFASETVRATLGAAPKALN